jgi:hypothetical protein
MRKCHLFYSLHNLKSISLAVSFLAWIIFVSWKNKSQLGSHPILGASENFNEKKRNEKAVRRPKRALETQMLGGMPKSQERVTTKIKWVYPRKAMKKKMANQRKVAKEKMKDTKSRTADSDT